MIDAHTHTFNPAVNAMVAEALIAAGPDAIPYQRDMSDESKGRDIEQRDELAEKFNDVSRRLADLATMGLARQVILPAPGQQHYWAPKELLAKVSAAQNDHVSDLVAMAPDRFVGAATLPLTDPAGSIVELKRVFSLGLKAVQVDSRADSIELSDPALDPVYAELARLGMGLIIHPLGFSHGQRLSPFFMVNSVAQPLEELIAFNHLVFGGVIDRHPNLKVCIVHGGGFAPFYIGRLDHTWMVRPEVRALIPEPPSSYLSRIYYDTCVFRPDHIETLVALAGADRVMLGSDYPFDMGDRDPVGTLMATSLCPRTRESILSGTAAHFFGL